MWIAHVKCGDGVRLGWRRGHQVDIGRYRSAMVRPCTEPLTLRRTHFEQLRLFISFQSWPKRTTPDVHLVDSPAMPEIEHDESPDEILSSVVWHYTRDFDLLNAYDRGTFDELVGTEPTWSFDLVSARKVIAAVREHFPTDELFGAERRDGLGAVLVQIEQSSFGEPLYATVEDRAAHIIYLTVKNHPLADGNKRSAVALAAFYLARNGAKPLPENMLAALTLVAATSGPEQKDQIIGVLRAVLLRNR